MSNLHENNSPNKKIIPKGRSKSQLKEDDLLIKWINELKDEEKRTKAICKLSEYSEKNHNLPIYLWYSQGTMAILLQEIISSYKIISSDKLTQEKAAKICNILLLLTSIASHNEIRYKFIESKMPIFLYPFLKSASTVKHNEYIKLLTLTVFSTLIKTQDPEIISFLINTQFIPILLNIIDKGPSLSKYSACIMIHLIVKADEGLKYICEEKMRYSAIILFMRHMLKNKNNQKIIFYTLKIFLRLAENNEARIILKNELLKEIKEKNFTKHLNDASKILHSNLLKILSERDEGNKIKENQKESVNKFGNMNVMNESMKNNLNNNQMMNVNNTGDMINQYNMNNNMMLVNQLNQMKISQPYMIQNNFSDVNNFSMYNNGNDSYLNKINYVGNQNNNNGKQFMNMNFYNMYPGN